MNEHGQRSFLSFRSPVRCVVHQRATVLSDALCISVLGTQVFLDNYATDGMRPALAREVLAHFSVGKMEALVGSAAVTFVLAETAGHLVGFVQVTRESRHALVPHDPAAEIDRLYVHERFTGRDVGKLLLHRAEVTASSHGAAALWLTAWVGNARAIAYYPKRGYTDVGATDYVFEGDRYENRVYVKKLDG